MNSTLTRSYLALCGLALMAPVQAEGQFGGLGNRVRRAVQEATAERPAAPKPPAEPAAATETSAAKSPYNDHVLQITPELLDRLETGLAAEVEAREEAARFMATVRAPEAYDQCGVQVYTSPAGEGKMAAMQARGEAYRKNPSDAAAMAAYRQAQEEVQALVREQCGPDPDQVQGEMQHLVREQCGPDPDQVQGEMQQLQMGAEKSGRDAAGLTVDQYAILKERIAPLCGIAQAAGNGEVRIPGEGKDIFWVYSRAEVSALTPRCGRLLSLVQAGA